MTTDWQEALITLNHPFASPVRLICDGYNVSFHIEAYGSKGAPAFKFRITFYIDGKWKGEYMNKESVIGQKFGRKRMVQPPKSLLKMYGAREANRIKKRMKDYFIYVPDFSSPNAVIRHLKKTCTSITLVQ